MQFVDLFCGCGGMSEGLRQAGWECLLGVDNDPYALEVFGANHAGVPTLQHDLNEPLPPLDASTAEALRHGGVLVGAPSCQDFSLLCPPAKRDQQERAKLTPAFAQHVAALRPTWVMLENVKYSQRRSPFLQLLDELRSLGYHTEHRILSIRDLGMAQPRYRLIMIGHAHGDKGAVDAVWAKIAAAMQRQPPVQTMRQTFAAYGAPTHGKNHIYNPVPRAMDIQPSIFSLDDRGERRALFTVRGRTRPIPKTYKLVAKDSTQDLDDVFAAQTVHLRALQGFPPTYQLHGCKGKQDQAIGNAVPPPLARAIGEAFHA